MNKVLAALALTVSATASAQPAPTDAPLAQVKDDKQLADALAVITQDPAIPVDDPATRALAQALMIEGVKQLNARAFDQALANFLEAYNKFPSPKILLNIGSTLRDMGRLADAANTYQRYLLDPATGSERVAEVKELLIKLDAELTILTVRVLPNGSDISIDGGPFIPVGSTLLTRVRPGIHLVRIRKGELGNEVTVNGFEGENKEVSAVINVPAPSTAVTTEPPKVPATVVTPPERVDGWLITGRQYGADDASTRERKVLTGYGGPQLSAHVPSFEANDLGEVIVPTASESSISSGVIGVVRIDGEGRGFAGGLGLAISHNRLEGELMVLKSDSTGGYLGLRVRILTGWFRPYLAVGVPGFAYDEIDPDTMETTTKLAIGLRGAAGIELRINGHFSVQGDIGYEHFFVDETTSGIDANILVPTLGVIGRL